MRTVFVWLWFGLTKLCRAEPGILSLKTFKNHQKHSQVLRRRDTNDSTKRAPFLVDLQNYPYIGGGFYYVNVTVGDPPQVQKLDIDTGSADTWMFGVNSCETNISVCIGTTFDETASHTTTVINKGGFQVRYFTQGSNVTGDYKTDSFTIGKQTIRNSTMGLARKAASAATGLLGIGFDTYEAIVFEEGANPQPYPNLVDAMKQQGLISTRAFSLYLDDLAADTGSIIFGGYDKAKFKGILQIQLDTQSMSYSTFSVILNSVGVTDSTGSTVLTTSNMPNVMLLDSGSALTSIPSDLFHQLVNYFGAMPDENFSWIVRCDLAGMTGTLDYQFSGSNGPLVSVPFKELAIPIVDLDSGRRLTDSYDNPLCRLGLAELTVENEPLILGDTFLRSAYVVYDLDNLQIGIAQTLFNVTDSNIEVISVSAGQNLPGNIASAATTIEQTNTQAIGGDTGNSVTSVPTAVIGSASGSGALTGFKTTYATQATHLLSSSSTGAGSTGAPKKADGTSLQESIGGYRKVAFLRLISLIVASLMGGMLVL
jgi:hypothetical protein